MEQKIRRDRNMGDNLRKLRLDHDISQEKLCAELQRRGCDIGRSTYAKYEAGELNIRATLIVGILVERNFGGSHAALVRDALDSVDSGTVRAVLAAKRIGVSRIVVLTTGNRESNSAHHRHHRLRELHFNYPLFVVKILYEKNGTYDTKIRLKNQAKI